MEAVTHSDVNSGMQYPGGGGDRVRHGYGWRRYPSSQLRTQHHRDVSSTDGGGTHQYSQLRGKITHTKVSKYLSLLELVLPGVFSA
jgi:hypothetical protein